MKKIVIVLAATLVLAAVGFFVTVAIVKAGSTPSRDVATAAAAASDRQTKGLIGGSVGAAIGLVGSGLLARRLDRRSAGQP